MDFSAERAKITEQLAHITAQRAELNSQEAELTKQLKAIDAYETVMSGKAPVAKTATTRIKRGGVKDAVLNVIKAHPQGIKRGDIIEQLGLKGQKGKEQSVSNVLATLKNSATVTADAGLYKAS